MPVHSTCVYTHTHTHTHTHTIALSNLVIKTRGHGIILWVQWRQGTLSECFYTIASPVHPSLYQSIPLVYTHPHTMALSNFVIKTRGHGVMLWVQWHQVTLSECFYTIASPVHPSLCQSIPLVYIHPHIMALSTLVIRTRGPRVILWVHWHQGTLSECFYTIASPVHPSLCQSIPLMYTHTHNHGFVNFGHQNQRTWGNAVSAVTSSDLIWVLLYYSLTSPSLPMPVHFAYVHTHTHTHTHTHIPGLCQLWSSKQEDLG